MRWFGWFRKPNPIGEQLTTQMILKKSMKLYAESIAINRLDDQMRQVQARLYLEGLGWFETGMFKVCPMPRPILTIPFEWKPSWKGLKVVYRYRWPA